ncbi:MAG: tRNA (N(6)-L-threonylcarbamoyladenosine(37)-C(2))-methylthiotransferase MtaB [Paludibacter sp.]|nr:tRNA (N(6)-L-threonylcarbamoyladenosine(37)-C(2))-methylthiotransferase MtaB [Bacteroidales bacterium]MCM1068834.1 tRNA (N(6)-L-threonylcarbamoyladenosine(37)-C(2))-methylthiotransferase MtaB [Prevotella sp.]MCM1353095.1 tRNA (N(6)-L-threonylcarbamoyladenosine(37)-C(2))-methylthiotransferase MtaB [Bacteroides sp.]MCM1442417.1 tRNA (N(6)-L-threonylcarbamoyladenosine(37)-C(2))-methylthiotransferase MtaB [Muribaculum sp.]MCM1481260.1 tRNA (N(6)-L-threonylcarbamoyladenosine(37)-C(2))-methylthiot
MKVSFLTLGCKLNFAESSALGKELASRGHLRAKAGEQADVCIVNTCSVTDTADHKDRQAIKRIRRQHPDAILIVTGCYAQLKPEEIIAIPGVDYVLGMNEKFSIPDFVSRLEEQHERILTSRIREIDTFHPSVSWDDRTRCFLKVQDGCNYFCTYCTIPLARGKSRNGTIASIVAQAEEVARQGAKEIVLTGVNIGDFGRTTGETFIDLLHALDAIDADLRFRISSCEPNLLTDEIIAFVADSRHFAPHFHIPLQSGSNHVLQLMKRHYTRELFAERVNFIKTLMPGAFIGVDVMTGVRGETLGDFEDAYNFIQGLDISQLHVFTYSERANTKMLEIDYIVPAAERKRRSELLHQLSEDKLSAFYAAHKGEQAVVLWESKREGDAMSGFTENYIRLQRPYDKKRINTFQHVVI